MVRLLRTVSANTKTCWSMRDIELVSRSRGIALRGCLLTGAVQSPPARLDGQAEVFDRTNTPAVVAAAGCKIFSLKREKRMSRITIVEENRY